jgi:hypothetical protein
MCLEHAGTTVDRNVPDSFPQDTGHAIADGIVPQVEVGPAGEGKGRRVVDDGVVVHRNRLGGELHGIVALIRGRAAIGWAGRQLAKPHFVNEVRRAISKQEPCIGQRTAQGYEIGHEPARMRKLCSGQGLRRGCGLVDPTPGVRLGLPKSVAILMAVQSELRYWRRIVAGNRLEQLSGSALDFQLSIHVGPIVLDDVVGDYAAQAMAYKNYSTVLISDLPVLLVMGFVEFAKHAHTGT